MNEPALIVLWLLTWMALLIMGSRLGLVKLYKKDAFATGDYLTMGAMFCAIARLTIIHVVLVWGSNNMEASSRQTHLFTQQEIYQRQVGGKLTLVNRGFYTSL